LSREKKKDKRPTLDPRYQVNRLYGNFKLEKKCLFVVEFNVKEKEEYFQEFYFSLLDETKKRNINNSERIFYLNEIFHNVL
jgi:hypothetical protein